MPSRTCCSVGFGISFSSDVAAITMPGVQNPHCRPWFSRNASCMGCISVADGADILTIEGLATDGQLHPMQQAFMENHGLQCGYCTPGMVMAATGLLQENPHPSEQEVRIGLEGNLCRCTGYHNIVQAVLAAAKAGAPA